MSFLENLENNLKNMESREERGSKARSEQQRREADRARSKAAGPYLEQLRKGKFTSDLMNEAARIGFGLRTKVYMTWIENTLRLEAREHRLELRAMPDGVQAQFLVNGKPTHTEIVDLSAAKAKSLAERWMKAVGPRPTAVPAEAEAE
jgi:hypothetical protein